MKYLKINRKHFISIDRISHFEPKGKIVWVHMKDGYYPPVLKSESSIQTLKLRLLNTGIDPNIFDKE